MTGIQLRKNYLQKLLPSFLILLFLSAAGGQMYGQTYCTSGATSLNDTKCDAVIFNTINNNTAATCANYSDFTSISTAVSIGQIVNLSVTAGTCGGNFTKSGRVFIDWNRDGDFLDANELVFTFGPSSATFTSTTNVTVPVTASIGSTRMRVVVVETGTPTGINSCGSFTWGETEDYTVIINPSSTDDVGITAVTAPLSGCNLGAADTVKVTVSNFGSNAQSGIGVSYRINGGAVVTENTGLTSIPSGGSIQYAFNTTANFSVAGTYFVEAWTTLLLDTIPINDTSSTTIVSIPGVSTFPYTEDFESGMGGWIAGGSGSTWAFGTPAKSTIIGAASGSNAWVTGGLGTGDYNNGEDSEVIGPCFDFSTMLNPWISMKIWWNSEFSWDGAVLQTSTDFGLTWNNVGAFGHPNNWYNDNSINGSPGGSQEGWTGRTTSLNGSNGWVTAAHALDGLAGEPSVRIRIAFGSDGSITDDGFAFDDVFIGEGPTPSLGPDRLICTSDSVILSPGTYQAYNWSTGDTNMSDTITRLNAGIISVIVTDTLGFTGRDTVEIFLSNPSVNLGPDSTICPGDTLVLNAANPGGSYSWNTGDTTQFLNVVSGGVFTVNVLDSVGCPATDSIDVTLAVPPALNLGPDQTVCSNTPVSLNAGGGPMGTTYGWSTGATTQVLVVTAPGQYIANVVTPGGCGAVDTINILNHPNPALSLGPDRVECGPFTLDAGNPGSTYSWSTGANTQTVNLTNPGTYSVTVTNSFGCPSADTVNISIATPPAVNLGPDQQICNSQTILLDAGNPGSSYLWSTGVTTQTITVSAPGTYVVQVTSPNSCVSLDTININASTLLVNLGPDVSLCGSSSITLNAGNPGSTYSWSTGATTRSINVSTPGTYTVTVTDGSGCNATDDIVVTNTPGVTAGITGPATTNLFAATQFTDASSGSVIAWDWDFGDGVMSTLQNPTHAYNSFGNFTVTLIATDGVCFDTTTQNINVNGFIGIDDAIFAERPELFPNPSSGLFNFRLALTEVRDMDIEVFDMQGRMVFQQSAGMVTSWSGEIDLSMQSNGIYTLKVNLDGAPLYLKLVKQ